MNSEISHAQLRGPILRAVSRSFYLSIRLLPAKLRDPIALAYLLARATDTIADTSEISAALRAEELEKLAARIQGGQVADDSLQSFVALQKNAAERSLIEAVPACL
ncbi:MAG: squalene/phytoene synthase family protein, partial [Chthoniobacterales bacterium]